MYLGSSLQNCHLVGRNKRKREAGDDVKKTNPRARQPKKNLELKNFYRFQIRDEKMKQLDMLRKKFEEDKQKVAKMKESRKFRPF
jgi:hypothetical protein